MTALDDLAARARRDLELFAYPPRDWVLPPRAGREGVLDVAIVGGGQSGIAVAFALRQARIRNIRVLDDSPAGREGPWVTFARMVTLRTIKELTGPALGQPALAFRSWYEAQHGSAAWEAIARIPKGDWMRYLGWLRDTLEIPVDNGVRVTGIAPADGCLRVSLDRGGVAEEVVARKVVLATGLLGSGGPRLPAFVDAIPRERWAHSTEHIDVARLAGRRVLVLGGGASAWDNAATALEAGAATVELHVRRPALPQVNSLRWMEFEGLFRHFADLDDASRWRMMRRVFALPTPPPVDTMARTERHPNFRLRLGAPWLDVRAGADGVEVVLPDAVVPADVLILGTGFATDLARRPELAALAPHVARWADRYTPSPGEEQPEIARHPYLGPGFELIEKVAGACPELRHVHLFNNAALPSVGPVCGGLNGLPQGASRVADAIARAFLLEDAARYTEAFLAYDAADSVELEAASRLAAGSRARSA